MNLSDYGALDRPASMSRRKQLRPFKVQDDDDDDDNKSGNAKQAITTDNGLETTPNGNNTDETLHSTSELGEFNVCICAYLLLFYLTLFTCFHDALTSKSIHVISSLFY